MSRAVKPGPPSAHAMALRRFHAHQAELVRYADWCERTASEFGPMLADAAHLARVLCRRRESDQATALLADVKAERDALLAAARTARASAHLFGRD